MEFSKSREEASCYSRNVRISVPRISIARERYSISCFPKQRPLGGGLGFPYGSARQIFRNEIHA